MYRSLPENLVLRVQQLEIDGRSGRQPGLGRQGDSHALLTRSQLNRGVPDRAASLEDGLPASDAPTAQTVAAKPADLPAIPEATMGTHPREAPLTLRPEGPGPKADGPA